MSFQTFFLGQGVWCVNSPVKQTQIPTFLNVLSALRNSYKEVVPTMSLMMIGYILGLIG